MFAGRVCQQWNGTIVLPISLGFLEAGIASELGTSKRSISNLLDELRAELN